MIRDLDLFYIATEKKMGKILVQRNKNTIKINDQKHM